MKPDNTLEETLMNSANNLPSHSGRPQGAPAPELIGRQTPRRGGTDDVSNAEKSSTTVKAETKGPRPKRPTSKAQAPTTNNPNLNQRERAQMAKPRDQPLATGPVEPLSQRAIKGRNRHSDKTSQGKPQQAVHPLGTGKLDRRQQIPFDVKVGDKVLTTSTRDRRSSSTNRIQDPQASATFSAVIPISP
jgi:hypothetical protein